MALFNRQNNSDIPPELQPYYDAPPAPRKHWLSWIVRGIAFLVLVGVIGVLVHWGWHEAHSNGKDTNPSSSIAKSSKGQVGSSEGSQTSSSDSSSSSNKSSSSSDNQHAFSSDTSSSAASTQPATSNTLTNTSSSSQAAAASSSAPAASSSTPAAPTTLTNTGPGSLVGLIAIAMLGGIVLYQTYLRRQSSRN